MKIAWPPTLLLICLIGTGFHCLQKLHADVGENINPIGVGWNECCLEIVRDAQACGDERLAAYIENWPLPDELGPIQCQIVASIEKKPPEACLAREGKRACVDRLCAPSKTACSLFFRKGQG